MTRQLWVLVWLDLALTFAHHVDHVLPGASGWPLTGEVTPFTASLVVYPLVLLGIVLTRRGVVGPGYWAALTSGGLLFVLSTSIPPLMTGCPPSTRTTHRQPPA